MRPQEYTQQAQQNTNAVPLASELQQIQQNPSGSGLGFLGTNGYGNTYGDANSITPVYNSNINQNMTSPGLFGRLGGVGMSGTAVGVGTVMTAILWFTTKNKDYALASGFTTLGLALGGYLQSR